MLIDAGYLDGETSHHKGPGEYDGGNDMIMLFGITWHGHEFLDSVRDPKIWERAKKGAEGAGGFTVDLLKDLAKGLVKKQIEEYTGVKL
jgi:hypothetical protein